MRMTNLVPAIIPKSGDDIKEFERKLLGEFFFMQIDIVDGIFVENKGWPFLNDDINDSPPSINTEYEVDLLVKDPYQYIDFFISAKAERFIFHYASTDNLNQCIDKVRKMGKESYVALTIHDNPANIKSLLPSIHGVQCMGIDKLGTQGKSLNEEVFNLMDTLRVLYGTINISVDGGVNPSNASALIEHGATQLVSGSALLNGDLKKNKEAFEKSTS